MKGFLAEIYQKKLIEIQQPEFAVPALSGSSNPEPAERRTRFTFASALSQADIQIIAEIKPASPTEGIMQNNLDLDQILEVYNRHACAISVLTDSTCFKGSFALLKQVVQRTNLPVLCKDFLIDKAQIERAYTNGASAVLLIVKMLKEECLSELSRRINDLGMTPVFEIQSPQEMALAARSNADVILINNRNLETLEVNLETTRRLSRLAPPQTILISASGIKTKDDIRSLIPYASRFLIGSALMKSANPDYLFSQLKETGLRDKAKATS